MAEESGSDVQVNLTGQIAIVTGASRGIGKAIAVALGRCGAKVACVARNEDKLKETVSEIQAAGGTASWHGCDVSQGSAVNELVEKIVSEMGKVQILVNNAGITRDTLLPRMDDDQWDEVIQTNLRGPFLFTRALSRVMVSARYGRIINISSVSGIMGNPGQSNYSASKAGLIGFTKTVARELGGRNITVNAIAPGFIESDMTQALGDEILNEVKKRIPAKRLGRVSDVSEAVLFLASKAASYITGQVLVIDGGMTA